jgi:hypothetical protein
VRDFRGLIPIGNPEEHEGLIYLNATASTINPTLPALEMMARSTVVVSNNRRSTAVLF